MSAAFGLNVVRLGTIDYEVALQLQNSLLVARMGDAIEDTLLLLEHTHTYTLGRGADERFIIHPPPDMPIHRVSRGGQVTYHGPGQLIGYPIFKLEGSERDLSRYLRKLEQVLINALERCGIAAGRREKLTGVWVANEKIASIGVGIRRWVTQHGFAINIATDLSYFDRIVPCGIEGCRMTSIAALGHREVSLNDFGGIVEEETAVVFGHSDRHQVDPQDLWRLVEVPGEAVATANP
ncbi:MAG TPA: lipoyl(octanoyl) transferase LipB [Candidatus Binataceae bacterium]|nr:lipoyl(octanoyl) transferase LipB [Candidatus Binataceae bacterium]